MSDTYALAHASNVSALAANALVTVAQAQAFLRVNDPAMAETVADYVNRASDYCDAYVGWSLRAREYRDLRLPHTPRCQLRPPAVPIQLDEPITLALDGTALTVWTRETDGDPEDFDVILAFDGRDPRWAPNHFWRAEGWLGISSTIPCPIRLTYTGGFVTVPGDLVDACLLVVENIYRQATQQVADVAAFGAGPVSPGVTYRDSLIPLKAKRILDTYSVVAL